MTHEYSQKQKDVIEQVQKLLALSKSENEHEAALALAKAEALLEKYRLDMTAIEMMTGQKEEIIEDTENIVDSENLTKWETELVYRIAQVYGCIAIRHSGEDNLDKTMTIVGRASDIMFVRYFVNYIIIELFRISSNYLYKKRKDYKESWFMGAVTTIIQRVKESQRNTQKAFNNPYAVVTINNRVEESLKKMKELYPNAIWGAEKKQDTKMREEAFELGRRAGNQIKLSHEQEIKSKPTLR